jgi:uncharacterized protein
MAFTIYDASIPPMIHTLGALAKILHKASAQAKEKDIDPATLIEAKLAPDMFAFARQVQIASDTAKGAAARLAGLEAPSFPDTETTFAELQARLHKTIDFLKSVKPEQLAGAEDRHITIKSPTRTQEFSGRDFLASVALPNFYFHVTAAYANLRHKGIEIGKTDYLGG